MTDEEKKLAEEEEKRKAAEDKIKLDEKRIEEIVKKYNVKPEELTQLISSEVEKARKVEKDKLYDTIQDLKKKTTDFDKMKEQFQADLQTKEEKIKFLETQGLTEAEKTKKELLDIAESVKKAKLDFDNATKNLEEERRKDKLDLFKERKLAELTASGVGYIPELISGNDENSILASIETSQNRFKQIFEAAKSSKPTGGAINPATRTAFTANDSDKLDELQTKLEAIDVKSLLDPNKRKEFDSLKAEILALTSKINGG